MIPSAPFWRSDYCAAEGLGNMKTYRRMSGTAFGKTIILRRFTAAISAAVIRNRQSGNRRFRKHGLLKYRRAEREPGMKCRRQGVWPSDTLAFLLWERCMIYFRWNISARYTWQAEWDKLCSNEDDHQNCRNRSFCAAGSIVPARGNVREAVYGVPAAAAQRHLQRRQKDKIGGKGKRAFRMSFFNFIFNFSFSRKE